MQSEKIRHRERFCKDVSDVVRGVDVGEINIGVIDALTNVMAAGIDVLNVFDACMETRVLCQGKGRLIIPE